jgi:hypothetical protein
VGCIGADVERTPEVAAKQISNTKVFIKNILTIESAFDILLEP